MKTAHYGDLACWISLLLKHCAPLVTISYIGPYWSSRYWPNPGPILADGGAELEQLVTRISQLSADHNRYPMLDEKKK